MWISRKGFFSNYALLLVLSLFPPMTTANELVFTYWAEALEPLAIRSEGDLSGGIIKDIGDELSARMQLTPKYIELPTKRISMMVNSGRAHVVCLNNPKWVQRPEIYHWSPALFQGTDNFLINRSQDGKIKTLADLEGMRIGTYNGYVYNEAIMRLFEQKQAQPVQVSDFEHGMKLVEAERIDTLIDFGSIIAYEIKSRDLGDILTMAETPADTFDFYCGYSLQIPYDSNKLDEYLAKMKQEGFFERVLARYR